MRKEVRPETEVEIQDWKALNWEIGFFACWQVEKRLWNYGRPNVDKVEVIILPRNPETNHTVIIKESAERRNAKAILEHVFIFPGEDCELLM